ncbi:MAG: hypothetical protein Q9173_002442 [Seirophora scorigena]
MDSVWEIFRSTWAIVSFFIRYTVDSIWKIIWFPRLIATFAWGWIFGNPWVKPTIQWIFFKQPVKIGKRYQLPLDYIQLGNIYMRLSIARDLIWTVPLALLLINALMVEPSCKSIHLRRWTVVDDLCAGTYFRPHDEDQWFLDLWTPPTMPANQSTEIDPHIEAIMVDGIRLEGIASQLRDQASKACGLAGDHGFNKMNSSLNELAATVDELALSQDRFSYVFFVERDFIIYRFRTFVHTYALAIDRTDKVNLNPWDVVFPWICILRAVNRHALSPWLPDSRVYSYRVRSEVQFQARRFILDSIAAVDRVKSTLAPIERVLNMDSYTPIGPAMDAVQWYQENINSTIGDLEKNASWFMLAPWCEYDWYDLVLPGCSLDKVHERRRLHAYLARGQRILDNLQSLLRVTSEYPSHVVKLRGELVRLGVRLDHITDLDLVAEGCLMLSLSISQPINLPEITWLRRDGTSSLSNCREGNMTLEMFSYNLGQVGDGDTLPRLSEMARLCEMATNRDMVHGGLHLICNFWSFARTFSPPGGDPLRGVQRSWVQERDTAITRYRQKLGADDASMIRRVAAAWDMQARARRVPEYLD